MKDNNYWDKKTQELTELEKQMEELNKQKKELGKRIHILKTSLSQHNESKGQRTDTEVYKMFGKSRKDLTDEELRTYNREMQKARRKRQRELS